MVVFLLSLLVLISAFLPSLAWLAFFLKEDIHPEPKRILVLTFAAGALSTAPALAFQIFFQKTAIASFVGPLLALVVMALIEELSKFGAAYFAVAKDENYDEPVDAMIYMVTAALGFAAIENLFIAASTWTTASAASLVATANILLLRLVGATLLHVLASGLLGFYWAENRTAIGVMVATIVHSIFNYLVLSFENTNLLYAAIFLLFALFFLFQDFEKLKRSRFITRLSPTEEIGNDNLKL
ncbi:MAG TPA: PrsW family glutamic-type intramembrane protease [Candidatus Paceibacterota bacterium]|nr:PrsW family glutamic-type intramembrane protease [Candidatus Paceibacterota bacterium]